MSEEKEKPKKKIKKITLNYSIDSFETLTSYHQSKGIKEAFFMAGIFLLSTMIMEIPIYFLTILFFAMSLMYYYFEIDSKKKLAKNAEWEESEIEVEEPEEHN